MKVLDLIATFGEKSNTRMCRSEPCCILVAVLLQACMRTARIIRKLQALLGQGLSNYQKLVSKLSIKAFFDSTYMVGEHLI